jgi:hypothetical protein
LISTKDLSQGKSMISGSNNKNRPGSINEPGRFSLRNPLLYLFSL